MSATILRGATAIDADGSRPDSWIGIVDNRIVAIGTAEGWRNESILVPATVREIPSTYVITPGFVDLHSHVGAARREGESANAAYQEARSRLLRGGTTRSLISLVSEPADRLAERLAWVARLTRTDPWVLGSHLEGPFLSRSRAGAQNRKSLVDPDAQMLERFIAAADGSLRQMTIAPELPGAATVIEVLVDAGVIAAIGHTEATYEQAKDAFAQGARLLTHAFNAMAGLHHREPGPVLAALEHPQLHLELIVDGEHVHPGMTRLLWSQAHGRVALITDTVCPACAHGQRFRLGELDVTVEGRRVIVEGTDTLAGSLLTHDDILRRAVSVLGLPIHEVVGALTAVPAGILGCDDRLGYLRPGYSADLVVLDRTLQVQSVWQEGALQFEAGR